MEMTQIAFIVLATVSVLLGLGLWLIARKRHRRLLDLLQVEERELVGDRS